MVKAEKTIRGYTGNMQSFELNNSLVRLSNHIVSIIPKEMSSLSKMNEKEACLEGERFLIEHFSLHPIKCCPEKEIDSFLEKMPSPEEIIAFFQNTKEMSPFKLTIRLDKSFQRARLHEFLLLTEEEDLLKDVIFNRIDLEVPNCLSPQSYIHEIVHSQLDSRKGTIEDSHNQEVISIFLELVSLFEKEEKEELLKYKIRECYYNIHCCIDCLYDYTKNKKTTITKNEYQKEEIYLISTLKALNLFRKFVEEPKMRKLILQGIQSIFDARASVEQLLKMTGVKMQDEIRLIMKL